MRHVVLGIGIALALAGATAVQAGGTPTAADYAGVYEGQWVNLRYGSFAPATIRIEVAGDTATIGVDLDSGPNGSVFGLGFDPPEVTFSAPLGSQGFTKPDDSLFGDVDCDGTPAAFSCTGQMISAFVLSGSISGGITGNVLDADYTLTVMDVNPTANGTLTATKLPELGASGGLAALAALAACARRRARCAT